MTVVVTPRRVAHTVACMRVNPLIVARIGAGLDCWSTRGVNLRAVVALRLPARRVISVALNAQRDVRCPRVLDLGVGVALVPPLAVPLRVGHRGQADGQCGGSD